MQDAGAVVGAIRFAKRGRADSSTLCRIERRLEPCTFVRLSVGGAGAGVRGSAQGETTSTPGSLKLLQQTACERRDVFAQLMEAVKYNSLGQISHALYDVGGEYRRNM